MPLKLCNPLDIKITGALPHDCYTTQAYYLGYGRNAWHSTWANVYNPNSISFDEMELKISAERQRVQGSVFKIEAVPALVFHYSAATFVLVPINEGSRYEYVSVKEAVKKLAVTYFWKALPESKRNWLLLFTSIGAAAPPQVFLSSSQRSSSNGKRYPLAWTSEPGKSYELFGSFAEFLRRRLKEDGPEPATAN
jgi:hypothetical protein